MRYWPLTAVLLAFWLGRETGAGDDRQKDRTLELDQLVVNRVTVREEVLLGPVRYEAGRLVRSTLKPTGFETVHTAKHNGTLRTARTKIVGAGISVSYDRDAGRPGEQVAIMSEAITLISRGEGDDGEASSVLKAGRLNFTSGAARAHLYCRADRVGLELKRSADGNASTLSPEGLKSEKR